MQEFVNRQNVERALSEVLSSDRSRYYLLSMIAFATAAAAGLALSAIWLGLVLLVIETRKALAGQLEGLSARQVRSTNLALEIAENAAFAAAPALAWFSRAPMCEAIAVMILAMLAAHTGFSARNGRLHALAACAPYGLLTLSFTVDAAIGGALGAALVCCMGAGFAFAAALHHNHKTSDAAAQDAEWVRQLNMAFGDASSAAWEIDFARGRLIGGDKLAAVLGRPVSYQEIIDGLIAPPADRALVKGAFAPQQGPMRQIVLEHAVAGSDVSVRHQAAVRTAPDGAPLRVTCISRRVEAQGEAGALQDAFNIAAAALGAQSETLRTLGNELSAAFNASEMPVLVQAHAIADQSYASLTENLRALMLRSETVQSGVDQLAHARHEAESANLAKSQFLANMSHELRTPLNAIIGYTEMLKEDAEDNGDTTAVQDLHRILTAAKHLLALINEILDLSKIEAGRVDVLAAVFDPNDLLDELLDTVRPLAEQNRNQLNIVGPRPEFSANTDAMKLRQCALNLLSNACKFTRDGEVDVLLERRMRNGVDHLIVTVRDTGIGMSSTHMGRLFQPFVQADPTITQQYGGTGLGLTITRKFAQLLGGDVSVESVYGEGSSFMLHVPVNFADAPRALGAAAEIDAVQGAEGAPLVIVIEDEPDARELAARALTRAGFAVQGVGGGEAGLALTRAKKPALVLLDIFLPDRSGWRVLQSLKHDPKTQDIPVVVLSVNEDRAHAMALGAAEHIVKPADRDRLAATVMRFARKRPAEAAQASAPVAPLAAKQAG